MKWIKSKFQGVRYREHPTRKHGVGADRYYTIFYKLNGKMIQEALGWASVSWEEEINGKKNRANWTEKRASLVLAELQKNHSLGVGPNTLKEKRQQQANAAALQKAESLTVLEFWEQDYLHTLKARIKSTSWQKEVSHFENRIKPLIGNKPLKTITPEDMEEMVEIMRSEKLAPRTQQYAIGTFFRIWKHAAKRKLVKSGENPASGIHVGKINNIRLRVLEPNELNAILEYLIAHDQTVHDITLFCAYTGCRFSEAARLTWQYIDFKENTVLFAETKNGESRELDLAPQLISMLKQRVPGKTGEYVFTKKDGSVYKEPPSGFKTAADNLSLNKDRDPRDKVTFHSLRHTAATIAARNGTSVKDMQYIFGWKTPLMVFRYVKADRKARKQTMNGLAQSLSGENGKIISITKTG